jgi:hypothetical protein
MDGQALEEAEGLEQAERVAALGFIIACWAVLDWWYLPLSLQYHTHRQESISAKISTYHIDIMCIDAGRRSSPGAELPRFGEQMAARVCLLRHT